MMTAEVEPRATLTDEAGFLHLCDCLDGVEERFMTNKDHPSIDMNSGGALLDNERVVAVLNGLLEAARDGEYDFQICADEATRSDLQQLFHQGAEQCHQAADALVQLIWRFGGAPAEGGTATGTLHGGWVHFKGALGAHGDLSLLEELERREDAAVARYREALAQSLPPEVRSFVEHQAQGAQRNHDRIRDLRDEVRARVVDQRHLQ